MFSTLGQQLHCISKEHKETERKQSLGVQQAWLRHKNHTRTGRETPKCDIRLHITPLSKEKESCCWRYGSGVKRTQVLFLAPTWRLLTIYLYSNSKRPNIFFQDLTWCTDTHRQNTNIHKIKKRGERGDVYK